MNSQIIYNLLVENKHEEAKEAIRAVLVQKINQIMEEVKQEMKTTLLDEEENVLQEATAKRRIVVRNGKKVIKFKCPPGYKKLAGQRRCVRITASKRVKMKRIAKKAARKRRTKKASINRKRNRSLRKRKALRL